MARNKITTCKKHFGFTYKLCLLQLRLSGKFLFLRRFQALHLLCCDECGFVRSHTLALRVERSAVFGGAVDEEAMESIKI